MMVWGRRFRFRAPGKRGRYVVVIVWPKSRLKYHFKFVPISDSTIAASQAGRASNSHCTTLYVTTTIRFAHYGLFPLLNYLNAFEDPSSGCWTTHIHQLATQVSTWSSLLRLTIQLLSLLCFLWSLFLSSMAFSIVVPESFLLVPPALQSDLEGLLVYNRIRFFLTSWSATVRAVQVKYPGEP